MKDFTWDYIVDGCERYIQALQKFALDEPERNGEAQIMWLKCVRALIDILPRLRAHSELGENPPMMSMFSLRWLLFNSLEVDLGYEPYKEKYRVAIVNWKESTALKEVYVHIDEATVTVGKFIRMVKDNEI